MTARAAAFRKSCDHEDVDLDDWLEVAMDDSVVLESAHRSLMLQEQPIRASRLCLNGDRFDTHVLTVAPN